MATTSVYVARDTILPITPSSFLSHNVFAPLLELGFSDDVGDGPRGESVEVVAGMQAPLMVMSDGTVGGTSTPMVLVLPSLEMAEDLREFQPRERLAQSMVVTDPVCYVCQGTVPVTTEIVRRDPFLCGSCAQVARSTVGLVPGSLMVLNPRVSSRDSLREVDHTFPIVNVPVLEVPSVFLPLHIRCLIAYILIGTNDPLRS